MKLHVGLDRADQVMLLKQEKTLPPIRDHQNRPALKGMKTMKKRIISSMFVAAMFAAGCNNEATNLGDSQSLLIDSEPPATAESDAHPSEGPHHGTLIELGNEEYHAELVHDESSVTIYILDAKAAQATPIDAADVAVNLVHDGKPEQFRLAASPDADDPAGKSSRFTLQNADLVEELEHQHATARLSVLIGGKSYRGEIDHDHSGHDHSGHEHAH